MAELTIDAADIASVLRKNMFPTPPGGSRWPASSTILISQSIGTPTESQRRGPSTGELAAQHVVSVSP